MTMKSTLPPGPLSSSFRAAIHFLARQSLTPLSRTAFVRQTKLLSEASASTALILAELTRLTPAPGK